MIIDFHTHRKRENENIIEVISLHNDQADREYKYHTVGFHPWWTNDSLTVEQLQFITQKYQFDPDCLGIGECGLDNLKGLDIEKQEEIFYQQITLANQLEAPIIVHCVRAFDRVLRMKKKFGQTPWVVHGFVRNKVLAFQAIDAGLYLSMAPHDRTTVPFMETLKLAPLDRIFLETDSDDSINISERYRIFAALRNLTIEAIEEQLYHNFSKFFEIKWRHQNG
jgi:TatD DNase family protein